MANRLLVLLVWALTVAGALVLFSGCARCLTLEDELDSAQKLGLTPKEVKELQRKVDDSVGVAMTGLVLALAPAALWFGWRDHGSYIVSSLLRRRQARRRGFPVLPQRTQR